MDMYGDFDPLETVVRTLVHQRVRSSYRSWELERAITGCAVPLISTAAADPLSVQMHSATGRRELDGVADEVEDDLSQSRLVDLDIRRDVRRKGVFQYNLVLLGSRAGLADKQLCKLADGLICVVELYLALLQLGDIKRVVEHIEETVRGLQ